MSNALEFIAEHLPRITADDVRQFSTTVEIRDARAFKKQLRAFVQKSLERVELPSALNVEIEDSTATDSKWGAKAAALRAKAPWSPSKSALQRGREILLAAYEDPANLSVPEFAKLARKTRQQIYKDIKAKKLLVLSADRRGVKIPEWQLDSKKRLLCELLLRDAKGVDEWTLYRALVEPTGAFGKHAAIEMTGQKDVDEIAQSVLAALGFQV